MSNILKEIDIRNFKRIRKAHLSLEGNTFVVSGENGAGKSSFLDAIAALFGGKDKAPAVPVRKGAKEATIIGRLKTKDGRSLKATVTFTAPNGRRLVVEDDSGKQQAAPQTLLDAFWSETSFDPSLFLAADPKDQVVMLKRLLGLDFTALDKEKETKYTERTNINHELNRAKSLAASLPLHPGVPAAEVSSADVLKEIQDANNHNRSVDALESIARDLRSIFTQTEANRETILKRLQACTDDVSAKRDLYSVADAALAEAIKSSGIADKALGEFKRIDLAPLEAELAAVMAKIKAAHAHNHQADLLLATAANKDTAKAKAAQDLSAAASALAVANKFLDESQAEHTTCLERMASDREAADVAQAQVTNSVRFDVSALSAKLSEVETTNRKVRANIQRAEAEKTVKEKVTIADKLTERLDEIDATKEEMLQKAPFAISGMSINETGVILDGLPLEQASDSQKIAIGVEMAAILNPDKPLMLVRHGALFTPHNLKIMDDIAEKRGLTCIVEIPSEERLKNSSLHFVDGVADSETSTETPAELPLQ